MKILLATYPTAFHTPGGGEIQLLAYRKYLNATGISTTLFDPWDPQFHRHDIVHYFSCVGGSIHFCNFVKELGLPLVVSSSLWLSEHTVDQYPINEIKNQLSLADSIVTNSDMESDNLSQILRLPRRKFATIYNGVEPEFSVPVDPNIFVKNFKITNPFVLNVGNIEPRKNQHMLAMALRAFPNMKLVLVGHLRDKLYADKVFAAGGAQVQYLGALPHDSVLLRSAYAACSAFCLPSTLETPGLAALEAFCAGAKVAVTQIGSTREYFGEHVTYLDPQNLSSIVDALRRLIDAKSPTISNFSVVDKSKYKWSQTVKPLAKHYAKLIAGPM